MLHGIHSPVEMTIHEPALLRKSVAALQLRAPGCVIVARRKREGRVMQASLRTLPSLFRLAVNRNKYKTSAPPAEVSHYEREEVAFATVYEKNDRLAFFVCLYDKTYS